MNGTTAQFRRLLAASLKVTFFLLFVAGAHADDIVTLTLTQPYPGGYTFYSYTPSGGPTQSNPISPYQISLTDTGGLFDNTLALGICYDINNGTPVQTTVSGSFVAETGLPYMEASFLVNQINLESHLGAGPSVLGPLSMAVWQVMWNSSSNSENKPFYADPAAQGYVNWAAFEVGTGGWTVADASRYLTFIPSNSTYQRFGIILEGTPPVDVLPEPGGLTLLGTGLVVVGALLRRRTRHSE